MPELAERNQPGTVLVRHRGMRRFCGWLLAEGELDVDPMANLQQAQPESKPVPSSPTPNSPPY